MVIFLNVCRARLTSIQNYIKQTAREHDTFRKICIRFAQRLHRVDMRMRLGLLQDRALILQQNERQSARDAAIEEAKRRKAQASAVKAQASMDAGEDSAISKSKDKSTDRTSKPTKKLPTIRPLSEAKAIESGANFISETFLFIVAGGLIVMERWWSNRREANRREDVAERLASLESDEQKLMATINKLQSTIQDLHSKNVVAVVSTRNNTKPPSEESRNRQASAQTSSQ